jgi:hypothetical protein
VTAHWSPAMAKRHYDRRPPVGVLVAMGRKPWRIVSVEDVEPGDWDDAARDQWDRGAGGLGRPADGSPQSWGRRPFRVRAVPVGGGPVGSMLVNPQQYVSWVVLPEHYAVCVSCGELAPCLAHTSMLQAEAAMVRLEREMALLPGCCPACQEPITSRQESVTFPGENLLLLTGDPGPTFHLRSRCRGGAEQYEEMWVRADPTRPRSLLTMFCEGTLIVHHDGSGECFGAVGSDCPSIYARHRTVTACFVQSHGCGRGCSMAGHPGTRLRKAVTR